MGNRDPQGQIAVNKHLSGKKTSPAILKYGT